jgi:cytochrome c oxidase assembly protein subunit 15
MSESSYTPKGLSDRDAGAARRLALGFLGLAGITYALVVLGALVRAHGAGLACPDWPLCFGEVVPTFDVRVAFEWGHRALAGSVSICFATLAVLCLRNARIRRELRALLSVAAALLALQILLGALTVWQLLAAWSVTSHLVTGNAFAISLVFCGLRLRELTVAPAPSLASPALRAAIALTACVLLAQLVLGGLVASKYAGLACPDWPTCSNGVWFPSFAGALGLALSHRLGAYLLFCLLVLCALGSRGQGALGRYTSWAAAIAVAQICVGVLNVLWRLPVEITGLHSALAAGLALLLALSLREAWRPAS